MGLVAYQLNVPLKITQTYLCKKRGTARCSIRLLKHKRLKKQQLILTKTNQKYIKWRRSRSFSVIRMFFKLVVTVQVTLISVLNNCNPAVGIQMNNTVTAVYNLVYKHFLRQTAIKVASFQVSRSLSVVNDLHFINLIRSRKYRQNKRKMPRKP